MRTIGYSKDLRDLQKKYQCSLITVSIDGTDYSTTLQGPASAEKVEEVRRLLMRCNGLNESEALRSVERRPGDTHSPKTTWLGKDSAYAERSIKAKEGA